MLRYLKSATNWKIAAILLICTLPSNTASAQLAAAPPSQPQIIVEDTSVSIINAPAGSTYYLAGFGRILTEPEVVHRYFQLRGLEDLDQDGRLVLSLTEGIPDSSVWVATNRDAGGLLWAVPRHFPHSRPNVVEDEYLTQGPLGPLLLSGEQLVVTYRRGTGAWIWNGVAEVIPSADPTVADRYLLSAVNFQPLAEADPPLDEFRRGDLLFAIDQRDFTIRRLVISEVGL